MKLCIGSRGKGIGNEIKCPISYKLSDADWNSAYGEWLHRGLLASKGKWQLVKCLFACMYDHFI